MKEYKIDINSCLTQKQILINNLINTKLLTDAEYDELKLKISNKTSDNFITNDEALQLKKYNIFSKFNIADFNYLVKDEILEFETNYTNTNIYAGIPLEHRKEIEEIHDEEKEKLDKKRHDEQLHYHDFLNTEPFYEHYLKNGLQNKFVSLQSVIYDKNFYTIDTNKHTNDIINNSKVSFYKNIENKLHLIKNILNNGVVKLDTIYTNDEFKNLINGSQFKLLMKNVIVNYYSQLEINNKKFKAIYKEVESYDIKIIKELLNEIFESINYKCVYTDEAHTNRPNDTLVFKQINNNTFKLPKKRLINETIFRDVDTSNIKRIGVKNGGGWWDSTNETIVYKNEFGNFRSYKVTKNKALIKLIKNIKPIYITEDKEMYKKIIKVSYDDMTLKDKEIYERITKLAFDRMKVDYNDMIQSELHEYLFKFAFGARVNEVNKL
jgi:hypothetical protein